MQLRDVGSVVRHPVSLGPGRSPGRKRVFDVFSDQERHLWRMTDIGVDLTGILGGDAWRDLP